MNKTRDEWKCLDGEECRPLLLDAINDIEELYIEIDRLNGEIARTERNREMWKSQVERQATELTALRKQIQQGKAGDE